jgi:hypothetical protein
MVTATAPSARTGGRAGLRRRAEPVRIDSAQACAGPRGDINDLAFFVVPGAASR